ncbi:hypothetical protein RRG08_006724 [Elysia crispata]|uniref:mRNA export factor GLE1 n=1 Tax=Elysia crispata TaxID=231223 RepID=A0AAE1BE57_9GAST|nr:hypothetical protein RRG08_006724 [Elysia crispata]
MSITEALQTTPKGRLKYSREINSEKLKNDLDQVSPTPLARFHEEKESSRLNRSFGLGVDDFTISRDDDSNMKDDSTNNVNHHGSDESLSSSKGCLDCDNFDSIKVMSNGFVTSPRKHQANQLQSPEMEENLWPVMSPTFLSTIQANDIVHMEEIFKSRLKTSLIERRKKFEEHNSYLTNIMNNKRQDAQRKIAHLQERRQSSIERKQKVEKAEGDKNLQSLKENHERHKEKMDSKQKEIEQKRLDLEREQKKKQEEFERRHQVLNSLVAQVQENQAKFTHKYETFEHKKYFTELVGKFKVAIDAAYTQLTKKLQHAVQSGNITDELVADFKNNVDKSKITVMLIEKQIEDINHKIKEAVEKKKQEEVKQAEDLKKAENVKKQEAAAAQECGVQALSYALKTRKAKYDLLAQVEASIKGFVTNSNPQMKQYRFDLQRAVNTPINAISGLDSHHLRDKLHRLLALLRGQEVKVSGRSVRADRTPEALLFCQNLVAKMLVRKGEEQVSSLHESAFPIAAVLLGLWCEFPIVGDLFMAHLQALCPYVLPYYHTRQEGESSADYHRSLGYKVDEDGTVEEQDKFLRRMSGLMRLYCACLVTTPPPPTPGGVVRPPQGHTHFPHPHGLEHGWMWIARTMDQDPHPDATASLIYDLLTSCGMQLLRQYSMQFVKLLYLLYKQYLPKLKDVAVTNATLGRLEIFLEAALKSGRIPQPEGILPATFWSH